MARPKAAAQISDNAGADGAHQRCAQRRINHRAADSQSARSIQSVTTVVACRSERPTKHAKRQKIATAQITNRKWLIQLVAPSRRRGPAGGMSAKAPACALCAAARMQAGKKLIARSRRPGVTLLDSCMTDTRIFSDHNWLGILTGVQAGFTTSATEAFLTLPCHCRHVSIAGADGATHAQLRI